MVWIVIESKRICFFFPATSGRNDEINAVLVVRYAFLVTSIFEEVLIA